MWFPLAKVVGFLVLEASFHLHLALVVVGLLLVAVEVVAVALQ